MFTNPQLNKKQVSVFFFFFSKNIENALITELKTGSDSSNQNSRIIMVSKYLL